MILEGLATQRYYSQTLGDDGFSDDENMTETAAFVMISLLIFFVYLFLVVVSVYTAYQCNKNNPAWMFMNIIISVFFPTLYLLVHPNLMLAHEGPVSYCNTL
jgi:hypothetical protein